MVLLLRRCKLCGLYTLQTDSCPKCGGPVKLPYPAKFSLEDKYRKYRLKMRRVGRDKDKKTVSA
ncbi:ribosome biogenesis protein [Candidatus Bathyarchaeota archaeon]|nr:ribosome biogenesis protein [Candidatus Bathyarchaeota archaeon]MDP6048518.1 RNA-protein complex protein Nop10 [Candidatus Bathyarchaeota archaeon]MDP6457724.1 RNA-protein complex protein Nop10 [Candidatus Bathyarchaeota archaeon]